MTFLYVLECQGNRFYVGKTSDHLDGKRVLDHFGGNGCAWTRRYQPIRILETKEMSYDDDEDRYTKRYMRQYGIDNVRGGSYSRMTLQPEQVNLLETEFATILDCCFRCQRPGHFIGTCRAITKADGTPIDTQTRSNNKRKGRTDPSPSSSSSIVSSLDDQMHHHSKVSVRRVHARNDFPRQSPQTPKSPRSPPADACYRCGRRSHYASDCFARRHVDGSFLSGDSGSSSSDWESD
jgi:predicted GIY-YIG superfamily endonuclease